MLIEEKVIDSIVEQLETDTIYNQKLKEQLDASYEDYLSYLEHEIFKILQADEIELLLFIHSVVVEAFSHYKDEMNTFDLPQFFDMEERMWAIYEEKLKVPFRERITPFFEQIDEEDTLAFIEDLLVDPEEGEDKIITATGRDVIWNISVAFVHMLFK